MAKLVNLIPKNNKPKVTESLEDMEVALPMKIEKFLDRLVATIKSYNLPKKKEQAVIAKVMDALKIDPSELNQTVQKLKRYGIVTRQKTGNAQHDFMGEEMDVDDEMTSSMQSGLASTSKTESKKLNETTYIKGSGKEVKDLNYTLTSLQSVYKINRQDMEALSVAINALIK